MTLKEKINQEFITAMKSKNKLKISVLKMLKADILNEEIAKNNKESLDDNQLLQLLAKSIKKRKNTIEEFKRLNKEEYAKQEEAELEYLTPFLPKQLSVDEIKKIVQKTISDTEAMSMKDMGKVIKKIKEDYTGQVDMSMVTDLVKKQLV